MEMMACTCSDLPAHDHFMGMHELDGVWQARWDRKDVGRIWVDWKKVARALMRDCGER